GARAGRPARRLPRPAGHARPFPAPGLAMRFPALLLTLARPAAASGCSGEPAGPAEPASPANRPAKAAARERRHDESSYSQPDKGRTADLELALALDCDSRTLPGPAPHTLEGAGAPATGRAAAN